MRNICPQFQSNIYENPEAYTTGSFNNNKAGRVCGIIGTILSALYIIWIIVYIFIVGAAMNSMPWEMLGNY